MNSYDSKHLRVLNFIEGNSWADISPEDIPELKVLIACNYVVFKQSPDKKFSVTLNQEGRRYHQSLARLAKRDQH